MIRKFTSYLVITLVFAAYTGSSLGLQLELKDTRSVRMEENNTGADTQESKTLSITPFNAIYQPGQLVFESTFNFEFELPDETCETRPDPRHATPHDTPYYKTLFGRIIVPNAP